MEALASSRPYPTPPSITSTGPPPERHADRIVAEMMRHLAEQRAHIWAELARTLAEGYRSASPRAQAKLAARVKQAGALQTSLIPGKKGRYTLRFYDLCGWDPARDDAIMRDHRIPEKPWLVCSVTSLVNPGKERDPLLRFTPVLFLTHHVLSRAAQRHAVRTLADLERTAHSIATRGLTLFVAQEDWEGYPAAGRRSTLPIEPGQNVTVVFNKHETRDALVATTIF